MAQQQDRPVMPGSAMEERVTGTVTCDWRITHLYQCRRYQTPQTCVLECVQQGSKFSLLVGNTPYVLDGNLRLIEPYAGGKATVTGVVSHNGTGNSIVVHAVNNPESGIPAGTPAAASGPELGKN
jgi:hypothetical protein